MVGAVDRLDEAIALVSARSAIALSALILLICAMVGWGIVLARSPSSSSKRTARL